MVSPSNHEAQIPTYFTPLWIRNLEHEVNTRLANASLANR